ncbi:MAG: methyltransferase domain-containing protein [Bdellovibrionales bacterium]|nr:methyltransferase domain-containing protein [Bdellovibrionales bacterium]
MIKVNYKTLMQQRRLGNKLYVMEAIRSLDEAIDMICEVLTDEEQKDPFAEDLCPYFGILWPAAEGLAIYFEEHPELIKNKTVLELGCGLGYPSLVATHHGANVLATDFHPDVEEYFLRNCRHSSLNCEYMRLNWREDQQDIGLFDVVMGSDVLYESKHASEVAKGLIRFLKPGGKIILSDPGRNYLQPFLEAMKKEGFSEESDLIKVQDKEVFVFVFSKN